MLNREIEISMYLAARREIFPGILSDFCFLVGVKQKPPLAVGDTLFIADENPNDEFSIITMT